jgi:hypothetical protein
VAIVISTFGILGNRHHYPLCWTLFAQRDTSWCNRPPQTQEWLKKSGKTMRWLLNYLRSKMGSSHAEVNEELRSLGGGYDWLCGGLPGLETYMTRADVQTALHLEKPGPVQFGYDSSGPASITLYPELVKKIRVLIYNGDSDACVPCTDPPFLQLCFLGACRSALTL